ncbi:MAG: hypothetical protein Q8907_12415 [Bacteroidota bacterium]|nr:hypothetical protein [Bacteroidota bacterium]
MFDLNDGKNTIELICQGFAIIRFLPDGKLKSLACVKFKSLKINDKEVLSLDKSSDVCVDFKNGKYDINIIGSDTKLVNIDILKR